MRWLGNKSYFADFLKAHFHDEKYVLKIFPLSRFWSWAKGPKRQLHKPATPVIRGLIWKRLEKNHINS